MPLPGWALPLLFLSHFATASSLVSYLSEKTNEIRNLERCQAASLNENKALSKDLPNCDAKAISNLKRDSFDQISEKMFFESAAQSQLQAYDCVISQADELFNGQKSAQNPEVRQKIAVDFSVKILKLKQLQKNLELVQDQVSQLQRAAQTSPMGETMPGEAFDPKIHMALKQKEKKFQSAIDMMIASMWQGGHHLTREFVQAEVKKKDFDSKQFIETFLKADGKQSFNSLTQKIKQEVETDKLALISKAQKKSIPTSDYNLSDQDKIRLYKDQNWLGQTRTSSAQSESMTALSCRLEGRYGIGRERFYTAVQVAGTVALTVVPGGMYLAAGRGLIAASVARTLSIAVATGASGTGLAITYEQKCPQSVMKNSTHAACDLPSKNFSEKMEHNNCALDVALAALDIPFPELKAASVLALGLNVKSVGSKAGTLLNIVKQDSKLLGNPQLDIWRTREAGQIIEARNAELAVQKTLESGKMKMTGMVGKGETGAFFVEFENGVEGVWKPSVGKHADGKAEVAASKIDRYLGADIVPVTVPRSLDGIEGTVQLKVIDLKEGPFEDFPYALGYFDYLIGNVDRHGNNYLFTVDGHLTAIDHGKSFYPTGQNSEISMLDDNLTRLTKVRELKRRSEDELQTAIKENINVNSDEFLKLQQKAIRSKQTEQNLQSQVLNLATAMTPSEKVVEKLRATTQKDWKKVVGDELTDRQIAEMMTRQKEVLESIARAEKTLGKNIYPVGPVSPLIKVQKDSK
ncbi:MAG: hypothetical protein H7235_06460 [Bdellovibrionaceae bacterium]|nr:hypothetical protein [Pseudobdellovibrionaceae bacterium]